MVENVAKNTVDSWAIEVTFYLHTEQGGTFD
jgi:hypothetical protein